jgi:hypothetical protein
MTGHALLRNPSPEVKYEETANSRHRATRAVERPSPNDSANEELSGPRKEAPQCSLMRRNRAESPNLAGIKLNPESRLNAAQQLQILDMFLAGYGYSAIARQSHRNRRTVTRICKSRDVLAKIQEQKAKLLGESDSWLESINFAVTHEMNGEIAFRLLRAFGAIPSPEKKAEPQRQNIWESVDPQQLVRAMVLGQIARERGSSRPPEADDLEKLMRNDQGQSNRKCRLFDCRDTD